MVKPKGPDPGAASGGPEPRGASPEPRDPSPTAGAWLGVPRNVWALSAASFLRDVASEMLVHLLPLFLANVLVVRTAVIGLIEGIGETTASLVKIYSGYLSDRLGRRKALTAGGYGIAAASLPVLYFAGTALAVAVARFLDRLGKGIRTAPRDALIADSVAAGRRGASFGLHRAADSAVAFVGLLLAILVVWRLQESQVELAEQTFRTLVAWATIPAALSVLVVILFVREARRPGTATLPRLSLSGTDRAFRRFLVVMVLFTLGNSSDAFLVLRAQSVGASVLLVLGMIALFNFVYMASAGPAGALSDRVDRRSIIVSGWILYAVVYVGFAVASATWQLWVLYGLYGAFYGLTDGVAKALVADTVGVETRGTAYGAYNAAIGITALPASVLAGLLWQGVGPWMGFGPAAPFLFGAALAVVASVLLWRWVA